MPSSTCDMSVLCNPWFVIINSNVAVRLAALEKECIIVIARVDKDSLILENHFCPREINVS